MTTWPLEPASSTHTAAANFLRRHGEGSPKPPGGRIPAFQNFPYDLFLPPEGLY